MEKASWIRQAAEQGKLRVTDNKICPVHNPDGRDGLLPRVNACQEHLWVGKKWFSQTLGYNSWAKPYLT
jgi:hypothetical protein